MDVEGSSSAAMAPRSWTRSTDTRNSLVRRRAGGQRAAPMKRRDFVKLAALSGATVMADRVLAKSAQPAARTSATPKVKPFELDELTLAELQAGLRSGRFSARALAKKYLARIEALDGAGPALRSVIEINPDALAIARDLDAEQKARGPRGPRCASDRACPRCP